MTDYEKIEKELFRLGYTREQGKGDHMKFTKKGVRRPISVSLSISGRTTLNAISNIRKIEPDFQLGRTVMSKAEKSTEDTVNNVLRMSDEQRQYARRSAFISVGQKVRYVSVEGRDWKKLKDEISVMNIPYVVKEILSNSGHAYISSPDDLVSLTCNNHEITIGPEDLASWELKKCRTCGIEIPASEYDSHHAELCDSCYELLTIELRKLTDKLPVKDIDKLTCIVDLKASTRAMLKAYQGKTVGELPLDLLKKLTEETDEWLIKKKSLIDENSKKFLPKVNTTENLYSRWKTYLTTLKTYYEFFNRNDKDNVKLRKETCKEILLSSYTETELKKWKVFNIVCAPSVSGLVAENAIYLYDMLKEYYKTDNVLVKCRCKGSDFCQYIPIQKDAKRQDTFLKDTLDDEDYRHECSIVRAFTAVPDEDKVKEVGLKIVDYWKEHGIISSEEANDMAFKTKYNPLYSDDGKTPVCGMPPVPVVYLCLKNKDTAEKLFSQDELLVPTLKEAGIDDHTEVILQDESGDSPLEYGIISLNNDLLADRPYSDPYDIIDVTLGIERSLYERLKDDANLFNQSMEEFLADILKEYIEDKEIFEETQYNNPKQEKDMAKTNETQTMVYTSLDSKNPTSPDEELKEKTTRELLRELKLRGVTFEGLSVPVVTRQSVNLDEI